MAVTLYDYHPALADFRAAVLNGLRQPEKQISPQFLYDRQGATLFEAITTLDEYYLTRTEVEILRTHAQAIATCIGSELGSDALLEFGSGSGQKVRILLDAAAQVWGKLPTYVAIDISRQQLVEACETLSQDYGETAGGLETIALCADYSQPLQLGEIPQLASLRKTAFFPGSSIGNFEPQEAVAFLRNVAPIVAPGGGLLVGVDLKKSKALLEPAYDDSQGISAAFALNLLRRMNGELGADFDLDQFRYRARYNEDAGRIEMHLVSLVAQTVTVAGEAIAFQAGETLRTEHSYKYSLLEFEMLAIEAGFKPRQVWLDPQGWFALHYLTVD
jgi:dimethylhistidine N-methyltransferase